MTRRRNLSLLAMLPLVACASATSAIINLPSRLEQGFAVEEHAYGSNSWETLDVYTPNEPGLWDAVVFFHGGRWTSGSKEDYRFVGSALARRGYMAILPNYRKYPGVRFPAFVRDGAKALAWVHDRIGALGGQPGRIHVAGHSSGAHIGALLTADESYLSAEGKSAGETIATFAGLAGPYDFTPQDDDLVDLFGPPEAFELMQATTFIDGSEPPMLLLYGAADETVAAFNHERLANRIRLEGGQVKVVVYPELGHMGIIGSFSRLPSSAPVVEDMVRFFASAGDRAK